MAADRVQTAAQSLAEFAVGLRFDDIPAKVVERVRVHLLDTLGVILAGLTTDVARSVYTVAREMGGHGEATVPGFETRLPAALAAMVNGAIAHSQDYDDTHSPTALHPSASVVPTAIAMAERENLGGQELVTGAVVGYETTLRVAAASSFGLRQRGFHPTAVCGAFGAAAAAGKLLGLDAEGLTNALGIVGSQAAGISEYHVERSAGKALHPGWAAHAGIMAALLAREGLTGPATVLEGEKGLFHTHVDPLLLDLDSILLELGTRWYTTDISIKLYPACHHTHPYIDAVLELQRRQPVHSEDVVDVVCYVPQAAIPLVCEPRDMKTHPASPYAARFSLPYCVAVALVEGHALPEAFSEALVRDPRILELTPRVGYRIDSDTPFPATYGGAVDLTLRDGTVHHLRVASARGTPWNPASTMEVVEKFLANARPVLPSDAAQELAHLALKVDSVRSVGSLAQLWQASSSGELHAPR